MLQESLTDAPAYTALLRPRLRMVLEALEDQRRTEKSEPGRCPRNLTVEHVMPRAWREHWGGDVVDEVQAVHRDALVETLGNLTLVNHHLNPALSNRPWTDAEAVGRGLGSTGKRSELLKHSTLKLNADLVSGNPEAWTEAAIRERTSRLARKLAQIWPRPEGTDPVRLSDAQSEAQPTLSTDAGHPGATAGKYQALTAWLGSQTVESLLATFDDVEDVLGSPLPASARTNLPYWYSTSNPLGAALRAAGYKPTGVNLTTEEVTFVRMGTL
jgi:hypothetical protein